MTPKRKDRFMKTKSSPKVRLLTYWGDTMINRNTPLSFKIRSLLIKLR